MDFLGEANGAGQLLLKLVSRGNAILAELLRLSDNIPQAYWPNNSQAYEMLIFDFSYLEKEEMYEKRIGDSPELIERDQDLKDSHLNILRRFYNVFESIVNYYKDLNYYLEQLDDGVFIQLSLENLLDNEDGKQLMSEALYLWCVMLTLLDELIPGSTREKLVMSYLRYKGHAELPSIDDVCTLCKSTGYISTRALNGLRSATGLANPNKRPARYPCDYFARFPIPPRVVSLVIGRLRCDDIYNAIRAYPDPDFRSVALSQQAAMLYLILYLSPETLNRANPVMREIADKYFPDNWIITYYLGFTVDLSQVWEPFKAARSAIQNTMAMVNVTRTSTMYWEKLVTLEKELDAYLMDGVLTEDYIMDHINKLLNSVRSCNVAIRWLLLHTSSACVNKKIKEAVSTNPKTGGGPNYMNRIINLLLNAAQFEFVMKNVVQSIMESKETRWNDCKREAATRLDELGQFFGGEGLSRIEANKTLEKYFHDLAREIDALDVKDSAVATGRKMAQMRTALEEVEQFHGLDSSLQVRAFLEDVRGFLTQMLRVVNIGPSVMGVLEFVSDFSYAWDVLRENNTYIAQMQLRIRDNPILMLKLRSVLVKLSSILNVPLVRINQANSKDLVSVSAFYSDELVAYVRNVLEVIPRTVFNILEQVIFLQTNRIPQLSAKVEKERIREFAQFDDRFTLAQYTYQVSVFTEGILAMETTLVGVDRVIPKQLLEDGIRKELVFRVASALHKVLVFNRKLDEFERRLQALAQVLDGYCRSFQYIQDYIRLQGLQVWQEEFMRIVNFNVERECAAFLVKKNDLESVYQSREVPIPEFPRSEDDPISVNFMGRLARVLLIHTDYHTTVYVPDTTTWYEIESSKPLVSPMTFQLLMQGINVFGLNGLDELFCFMIVKQLQVFLNTFERVMNQDKMLLPQFVNLFADMSPLSSLPKGLSQIYEAGGKLMKKLVKPVLDCVCQVGQIQLLREQIASTLRLASKTDAGALHGVLDVLNDSLMKDVQAHYKDPENMPYPDQESPLLPDISKYLDSAGLSDALTKIYVTTEGTDVMSFIIFLAVLSILGEYEFNSLLGVSTSTVKKEKARRDSTPLIVGIVTLLRQFHSSHMLSFVQLCGQYIRTTLNQLGFEMVQQKQVRIPQTIHNMLYLLDTMLQYARISPRALDSALPPALFHFIEQNVQ